MPETIAVINQKGGVGKSTTVLALGAGLRARGLRVLLVDLDAQGNLSYTAGSAPEGLSLSAADLLMGAQFDDVVTRNTPFGDVIPGSPALSAADLVLTATGKEYRLREALEKINGAYDYILLDTPPALGIVTVNALTAATCALIPALADIFSLQGIGQLYATIDAVRKYTNPALEVRGILLTRFSPRTVLSRDMTELLEATARELGTKVFNTRIRDAVAVREAQASRADLFTYAPKSAAAADYAAFLSEFLGEAPPPQIP